MVSTRYPHWGIIGAFLISFLSAVSTRFKRFDFGLSKLKHITMNHSEYFEHSAYDKKVLLKNLGEGRSSALS